MSGIRRVLPRAIDAHCHVHDPRLQRHARVVMERASAWNVTHIATCACFEEDWRALDALLVATNQDVAAASSAEIYPRILPSFGVHPWWADAASSDYLARLRTKLLQYPHASIGEIGLCKSLRGRQVDFGTQQRVFREQLQLAVEMQRSCVIHCVGAYGKLLEMLQAENKSNGLPPVVILHSFSGAVEMVSAFLALSHKPRDRTKIFFSLNSKQLYGARQRDGKPTKSEACCMKIPLTALLLETDAPDQMPGNSDEFELAGAAELVAKGLNEPALVQVAVARAAEIRKITVDELASAVYENGVKAFNISVG